MVSVYDVQFAAAVAAEESFGEVGQVLGSPGAVGAEKAVQPLTDGLGLAPFVPEADAQRLQCHEASGDGSLGVAGRGVAVAEAVK